MASMEPTRMSDVRAFDLDEVELQQAERVARAFHEAYERLAPVFGWQTQPRSRKEWADVPAENKDLMVAVVAEIFERLEDEAENTLWYLRADAEG